MPNQHSEPLELAQRLIAQLVLANATDLARRRQHAQAESLLADMLRTETPNAAALDLLARVRAQQGRLLEADALWTRAAEVDPNNPACAAARRCLARILRRPLWLRALAMMLVCAAVLSAIVLVPMQMRVHDASLDVSVRSIAEEVVHLRQRSQAQASDDAAQRAIMTARLDEITALSRDSAESQAGLAKAQGELRQSLDAALSSLDTQGAHTAARIDGVDALNCELQGRIGDLEQTLRGGQADPDRAASSPPQRLAALDESVLGLCSELDAGLTQLSEQLHELAARVAQVSTTNSTSTALPAADIEFVSLRVPGSAATTFHLSKTEITLAQYRRFRPEHSNGSTRWGRALDHPRMPVVNVSPEDAAAFCVWLGEQDGRTYRLPSEQEWEDACRAGSAGAFFFGNDRGQLQRYAWYDDNASGLGVRKESRGPQVVAQKQPNPFGLFDMLGNVAEWCVAPDGGYVRRGGDWDSPAWLCDCAAREQQWSDAANVRCGFRIALEGER